MARAAADGEGAGSPASRRLYVTRGGRRAAGSAPALAQVAWAPPSPLSGPLSRHSSSCFLSAAHEAEGAVGSASPGDAAGGCTAVDSNCHGAWGGTFGAWAPPGAAGLPPTAETDRAALLLPLALPPRGAALRTSAARIITWNTVGGGSAMPAEPPRGFGGRVSVQLISPKRNRNVAAQHPVPFPFPRPTLREVVGGGTAPHPGCALIMQCVQAGGRGGGAGGSRIGTPQGRARWLAPLLWLTNRH
jgi:hypothetical protein